MFASASPDNIKQWKCPEGKFIQNLSGHNAILNCLAINADNVMVSGADNGSLHFWDFKTGYNFQRSQVMHLFETVRRLFLTFSIQILGPRAARLNG